MAQILISIPRVRQDLYAVVGRFGSNVPGRAGAPQVDLYFSPANAALCVQVLCNGHEMGTFTRDHVQLTVKNGDRLEIVSRGVGVVLLSVATQASRLSSPQVDSVYWLLPQRQISLSPIRLSTTGMG